MTYVNRDAKIKPGEGVISSGFGGVFPKGIFIGDRQPAHNSTSKPACTRTSTSNPPWIFGDWRK